MKDLTAEIIAAHQRIQPFIRQTPLMQSLFLSKAAQAKVFLKCENFQITHSFKLRGAFNKLLTLTEQEQQQGIVAASTGNHGAATAYAMRHLNIRGKIFVPENVAAVKKDNILQYGAQLEYYGTDCVQTELHALDYAQQKSMTYLSPYNDWQVVAGQGTIGLELKQQLSSIDTILVPVGGGGLIAGIAAAVKSYAPRTQIIGCLPHNSPIMFEAIKAGKIINRPTLPTLSDATAGGIETDAITFALCQQLVDDYILVSEQEIADAILTVLKKEKMLIEGAAGVAVAALLAHAERFAGQNVVIILSGANMSFETLKKLM